ncbi:MAG: 50S ribosomal protein L23 [Nitrososphaerota archaeon]|nr:50S ribosomal protein L23 [Nitrososphaerota archaeon]MDG7040411.1 50S ribosomal protein L23 [Nitrososphaerota archaeon]MDG7041862.1 50S ribosomal protein L23 [Nitrososphaerota archaeon]MDG7043231.1 50S ribosomal protein L23 [Nitrososphaerota archaeon]MDG7046742.1 50S ribosomal protein L23 [Nitrososphaerota archaeon]
MKLEEAFEIIKRPHVTEKTYSLSNVQNEVVFLVRGDATKGMIREAVQKLYEVKVKSIRTMKDKNGKKAYVRLDSSSKASDLLSKLGVL